MPDKIYLRQMQALPLRAKLLKTQIRIKEWYEHWDGNVFVSFSGGKDSTALAHIVHEIYPEIPLVFCNTGLEYPEIQDFARRMGAEFTRPKMSFSEVISQYGYPIISKENAEAIYYARRIRNVEGGVQTHCRTKSATPWEENLSHKERNSLGREPIVQTQATPVWGGYTILRKRLELMGYRVLRGGGYTQETVRRNLIMGYPWNAVKRTGQVGEETLLPG